MEMHESSLGQLSGLGQSLERSMQRHVVDNDALRSAFAELAFEIALARGMDTRATAPTELSEPTSA